MRKPIFIFTTLFGIINSIISCKVNPDSNRDYDKFDPNKTYKLQLNPVAGSSYYYDIANESETEIEANGETTVNKNRNEAGIVFKIDKDSAGNFLLNMQYDKIHIYTKNGDKETEMDAANANSSLIPAERTLGFLKDAKIITTVNTKGETISISGYKELGDKILAQFDPADTRGKAIAQTQWEKQFGNKLVKNNIDQIFKVFPDSAVHLGDSWRLTSKHDEEIGLIGKSNYKLKAINSDIALISSEGTISSDNSTGNILGMNGVIIDIKGTQEGEFEMETKTGMLISAVLKVKAEGTINVMGREIPVEIKTTVKINGRRK